MYEKIRILEEDVDEDPTNITPLFEIDGEVYGQNYPKRLKHTFPRNGKWTDVIEYDGVEMKRYEKHILKRYVERVLNQ